MRTRNADTTIIRIGIANLAFSLGGDAIVSVSGGSGAFFVTPAGIAGDLQATIALNVPQVSFSGALRVQLNTTQARLRRDVPGRRRAAPRACCRTARTSASPARTST